MSSIPCLVLGDDYRALGIARSLGRRGIPVWLLATRGAGPTQFSRYARRLAWLGSSDEARLSTLTEVAARPEIAGAVVFPTEDTDAELLARHHDVLADRLRLTVPPLDQLNVALDKRRAAEVAQRVGVRTPQTHVFQSQADINGFQPHFPLILKPALKEDFNRFTQQRAWRVDSREEFDERYRTAAEMVGAGTVLVQELLPGGGETQFSYAALCQDGRPLAEIVARRARQFPIDFGRSSSFVEVVAEPEVRDAGIRLLAELRYTGLVEIELKRDVRNGEFALLDINPRLWTWHMLGARAGVDFPYLAWLHFSGQPVPRTSARVGSCWIRRATDAPAAIMEIRRGRLTAGDYLASMRRPKESAVFAGDDPVPGVVDVPLIFRRSLVRGPLRRLQRRVKGALGA